MTSWYTLPPQDVVFNVEGVRSAYVRMAHWPPPLGWTLTDIAVPPASQGQGLGRELMKRALEWADTEQVSLCITVAPAGPMDYEALESWYMRLGFAYDDKGILRREPQ